jgi:hypothetical protein
MPNILHITDLHLVAESASQPLESHRVGLVPTADRASRQRLLRHTLHALGEQLCREGPALDAVVVTGDVAEKNSQDGYVAFLDLIHTLGAAQPPPDRILVVPGNHDVRAGLRPGDPERYGEFVRHIRNAGFITPCLDGVDGSITTADEARRHIIVLEELQIVPIDSAAFSQVLLDTEISDELWRELEGVLRGRPDELAALQKLRSADAARVSNAQLEALRQILLLTTPHGGVIPVRVAALHHHLLPVSAAEEVKPFESLTNLGRFRQFLRDEQFAVVLHGHKHKAFSYVDHVSSYSEDLSVPASIRVLSGADASGADLDHTDVCRLVDIDTRSGLMRVRRVGLASLGSPPRIKGQQTLTFIRPGTAQVVSTVGCTVITGETVEFVYPHLIGTVGEKAGEVEHVICRVNRSPDVGEIATIYPRLPAHSAADRLKEFDDLVKWWQFPSAPLTPRDQPAFTHGSRIRQFNGYLDQIQQVIESLQVEPATSRSMVVLLNPPADRLPQHEIPFPSFCMVQFTVQRTGDLDTPALACTAYFRKQEVRYWWHVNLAELAELQRQICDALHQGTRPELRSIAPGPITTLAARAHTGNSPPKVQVPLVDRFYSLSRERLYAMVQALIWGAMPDRSGYAAEWARVLSELNPPETPDPDGVAIAQQGLRYLLEEVGRHLEAPPPHDERLQSLRNQLEQLLLANQEFALHQQRNTVTSARYREWRSRVAPLVGSAVELSSALVFSEPKATDEREQDTPTPV